MKNSILLLLCLLSFQCIMIGQNPTFPSFYKDKWKVKEIKTVFNGLTLSRFDKDSVTNVIDFTKYEIRFDTTKKYTGSNPDGIPFQGTWSFFGKTNDSIYIDSVPYKITLLNEDYFTTRKVTYLLADTTGRFDTASTYFTLYRVPLITNIGNIMRDNDVKVHSIPAKENLTVEFVNQEIVTLKQIQMYNVYGQLVKIVPCNNMSSVNFNVQDLASGYYTLEILNMNGSRRAIKKIIKE